jgi:hypothetical protein
MNIRFTSSLTPEDENTLAPALLTAVAGILDLLPIAYSIRIDTTDLNTYHHKGAADPPARREAVPSQPTSTAKYS